MRATWNLLLAGALALLGGIADIPDVVQAIDFSQWKDCKSCLDAGYGWCPIRRMCGGFANRQCRGDHTDKAKSDEERAAEKESQRRATAAEENSDVLVATDSDFDAKLDDIDVSLVEFYAPWCGHCKALAPAYEEAATTLRKEGSKSRLVKVDATSNKNLASRFGIKGFPTLKLFRGSEFEEDYSGGRDAYELAEFMRRAAEEASKPRPKLERVVDFSMASASSLLKHKVNRQLMIFGNKATLAKIRTEVVKAGDRLEDAGPNMLILLLSTEDSSLRAVIERFEVRFGAEGPMYRVADNSGSGGLKALRPRAQDDSPAHPPTAAGFVQHCQDFVDGKFARVLRSADRVPPPLIDSPHVHEIIGNQFESKIIGDDAHDALVFFYMPGCGHCKALKPHFQKIATYMPIDNPTVKYFTIDGTRNEVESSPTEGYPTVYFYPRGNKRSPEVVRERDEAGLRNYIAGRVADAAEDSQDIGGREEL